MDWRADGIRVWSFPRDSIPADILAGQPTTAGWPVPDYDFTGPGANIASHFNAHQIIFDLTYPSPFLTLYPMLTIQVLWGLGWLSVFYVSWMFG